LTSDISISWLKQGDIRQSLFRLDPKNQHDPRVKTTSTLGKLEIAWRSSLGENGKIITTNIERKLTPNIEIEVVIRSIPPTIQLEKPFHVQCEITNRSGIKLKPKMLFAKEKMTGVMVNMNSGLEIGKIVPEHTKSVPLVLFPSKPGVQKITGIIIYDEGSGKTFECNDIFDVFVE
jgi:hypothetical protein